MNDQTEFAPGDSSPPAPLVAQYFLNHELDPQTLKDDVKRMVTAGYQVVCAHARQGLTTPYLSDRWWQAMEAIIEACAEHGIQFWIWDEDYFPSGLAGGRLVWDDPGIAAQQLDFAEFDTGGEKEVNLDFPAGMLVRCFALRFGTDGSFEQAVDVTEHCGTRRQCWDPPRVQHGGYSPLISAAQLPHWRAGCHTNRFALQWRPPQAARHTILAVLRNFGKTGHPDILNPASMERFLACTHAEYHHRFKDRFGSVISGTFTDEPSPGNAFPWNSRFADEFGKDHGYDIMPFLYALGNQADPRYPTIRAHYRQTQHRLQYQAYVRTLGNWCCRHGILSAGHLSRTEWLDNNAAKWPNQIRFYQGFDIPCADPLGTAHTTPDHSAYHTGLKVAASAAHLFGKQHAGSDALAVVGEEAGLRDLKFQLDYQMVMGISHFTLHGLSYSLAGPRKDEVPPSLFFQHAQWPYMRNLLDYVEARCRKIAAAAPAGGALVLYPHTRLAVQYDKEQFYYSLNSEYERFYHHCVETWLSAHKNFDLIDETTLQEAVSAAGKLELPAVYSVIVLPDCGYLETATGTALNRFSDAGGTVVQIGATPRWIGRDADVPQKQELLTGAVKCPDAAAALPHLPGNEVIGQGAADLLVLRKESAAGPFYIALNRAAATFRGRIAGNPVVMEGKTSIEIEAGPEREEKRLTADQPDRVAVMEISHDWEISFPANTVPLNYWEIRAFSRPLNEFVHGSGFDLMQRQSPPLEEVEKNRPSNCRFMLEGTVPDMRLLVEEQELQAGLRFHLNGHELKDWRRAEGDNRDWMTVNIGSLLIGGSLPRLNHIAVASDQPSAWVKEVAYLSGSYTAEYRRSHPSVPFLNGCNGPFPLSGLVDWRNLGYPTLAGTVAYRREITVPATVRTAVLDLGRVEDIAAVYIDNTPLPPCCWPPYRVVLPRLAAGDHELVVKVTNRTANRTRKAGLPAGLLGPVRIYLYDD